MNKNFKYNVMKQSNIKFFSTILFFFISFIAISQTAIGKKTVENNNVLLDFNHGEQRGIILPWVTNQNDVLAPIGGTIIYDSNDKKIKYFKAGSNSEWMDLSVNQGQVDTSIQNGLSETNNKTVIGSKTSDVNGVLVLEADDKAMVLPKVTSPHLNIIRPAAGTVVYDNVSKMMCLFNGNEWSFWKVE